MTEFMITLRNSDGSDGVGPPRYLTFEAEEGPDQELEPDVWVKQILAAFPVTTDGHDGSTMRAGDILFLVHGFNVSHDAACAAHVQCAHSLEEAGWTGLF